MEKAGKENKRPTLDSHDNEHDTPHQEKDEPHLKKQTAHTSSQTILNKCAQKKVIIPVAAVLGVIILVYLFTGPLLIPLYNHFNFADDQVKWAVKKLPIPVVGERVMNNNTDLLDVLAQRGEESVSLFEETLENGTPYLKYRAANGLAKIGPKAKTAIPTLLKELDNPYDSVRMASVIALGRIARGSSRSFPGIYSRLSDEARYVRIRSAESLALIDDKQAIPHLEKAARRESEEFCKKLMYGAVRLLKGQTNTLFSEDDRVHYGEKLQR